ncbi:DUF1648 domain-containing protein [Enterococcus gilvus]|uniref:DUF1648 domain-containing protein n=1 Tax=Enterococcus gilvus TaxID=160453 RepID=UPI003ED9565F
MIIRVICLVEFLLALYLYFVSPSRIILHFSALGIPDNYGPKYGIFIQPILLSFISEILIFIVKRNRKYAELYDFPDLLLNEWKYISAIIILFFIFSYIMFLQVFS